MTKQYQIWYNNKLSTIKINEKNRGVHMKIIVGLGNYGAEYAKTRHNIGFMAADIIAEKLNIDFTKEKFHAQIAETNFNGEKIILMKKRKTFILIIIGKM